jgi:hypothetical protein
MHIVIRLDIKLIYLENNFKYLNFITIIQGLCDAYLKLNYLEKATKEAKKMLSIGESINNPEQMRIAEEILVDCEKASKK